MKNSDRVHFLREMVEEDMKLFSEFREILTNNHLYPNSRPEWRDYLIQRINDHDYLRSQALKHELITPDDWAD